MQPAGKRVLSGIQPSGTLHLGNYFGAIQQYIELQETHDCFFFIANYHAMNALQDAKRLRQLTFDVAADYLALGLDPNRALLFRQTDVPEVCELAWMLSTVTGKGLLERAHSYKDKVARGIAASMGLFCYPVLMAADILIYGSDLVPVGRDQLQHIEMTQDMQQSFNAAFGTTLLKRPEPRLNASPVVPGVDGQKMSKSYGNTIDIFGEPKEMAKRIKGIKTDSLGVEAPKDPDKCNVFALLKLLATPAETAEWAERYRKGGVGYGEAKKRLHELYEAFFGAKREARAGWAARADEVEDILTTCGRKARAVAIELMAKIRDAAGLQTSRRDG